MKVAVFTGPKGSGKDTCSDLLRKENKLKNAISFALPLKRICSEVFDLGMPLFTDVTLKEKPFKEPIKVTKKHLRAIISAMLSYVDPAGEDTFYNVNSATDRLVNREFKSPREILQIIGTEFMRDEIHPDWHCMAAFSEKNLELVLKDKRNVTVGVTDCRFPNEFEFLLRRFGDNVKFFYVERPEAEERLSKATHRSETSVLEVKELMLANGGEVIENNGTLEELTDKLKKLDIPKTTGKQTVKAPPGSRFRFGRRGA